MIRRKRPRSRMHWCKKNREKERRRPPKKRWAKPNRWCMRLTRPWLMPKTDWTTSSFTTQKSSRSRLIRWKGTSKKATSTRSMCKSKIRKRRVTRSLRALKSSWCRWSRKWTTSIPTMSSSSILLRGRSKTLKNWGLWSKRRGKVITRTNQLIQRPKRIIQHLMPLKLLLRHRLASRRTR